MNVRDLVPWTRNSDRDRSLPASNEPSGSIVTLHREMNRLFDDSSAVSTHPRFGVVESRGRTWRWRKATPNTA